MITTTFAKLRQAGACDSGYKKLAKTLGGVTAFGKDTPITLLQVLESNGLDDALWAFRAACEVSREVQFPSPVGKAVLYKIGPSFQKRRWLWTNIGLWIVFYDKKEPTP